MWDPVDVPRFACVLHLVTVETAPVYFLFYASLDVVARSFLFFYLWDTTERPAGAREMTVGEYVSCVLTDVFVASFSLNENWKGTCADMSDGSNGLGWFTYSWIALSLVWMTQMWCAVLCKGGLDMCSGRYVKNKLEVEGGLGLKITTYLMSAHFAIVFMWELFEAFFYFKWNEALFEYFMFDYLSPILIVFFSITSLSDTYRPRFDYSSPEFDMLRFRRSWGSLFWSSSTDFARTLERAVMLGHNGFKGELEALLIDPSDADHVLDICRLLTDDEAATSRAITHNAVRSEDSCLSLNGDSDAESDSSCSSSH